MFVTARAKAWLALARCRRLTHGSGVDISFRWLSKWAILIVCCLLVLSLSLSYDSSRTWIPYSHGDPTKVNITHVFEKRSNFQSEPFFEAISANCSAPEVTQLEPPSCSQFYCQLHRQCQQQDNASLLNPDQLCSCFPGELRGDYFPDFATLLSLKWSNLSEMFNVDPGGHWKPAHCTGRRRVAVIVPYRDRENHLRAFLSHYHPLLQRQLLEYQIFVVEQNLPYIFNKASVMNAGFLEAQKLFDADCILFHDIDTFAERDDNLIVCGDRPVHWASYVNRTDYSFIPTHFGGATLLSKEQFVQINGYSNVFWGWGGEDDDFLHRISHSFRRYDLVPKEVGRFSLLTHGRDITFKENSRRFTFSAYSKNHPSIHKLEGLNTVNYKLVEYSRRRLYTWLMVDILEPDLSKLPFSPYKSSVASAYRLKVGNVKTTKFTEIDGRCNEVKNRTDISVQYKSRSTCRYLCEQPRYQCLGFEYHEPRDSDSFCILLVESCKVVANHVSADTETRLFIAEPFLGSFPGVKTEYTNNR